MDRPVTPLSDSGPHDTEVGPYRLLRSLGKGGMAEVFLAVHRHLGHVRALKVLWPEASETRATLAKRLLTEARATSRLRHPAIVQVFDCDNLEPGGAFIAMEYLKGEPADEWLDRVGALGASPRLAAAFVGVVADALAHAHAEGIVHRDVKPGNLILVPDAADGARFTVKILDFGIAKMLNEKPLVITQGDRVLGTPLYMAPEQWMGGGLIDPRTDIYSLGCVLFEILTGRPPFSRDDGMAMMHAHLQETAPRIGEVVPGAPEDLEKLVCRMLAKSPDARPQTMAEVLEPLESFLGRDRSKFAALLQAPAEFPVASGSARQAQPTRLGLGSKSGSRSGAAASADPRRRARVRLSAGIALAVIAVVAVIGGSLLGRGLSPSATPVVAAPPPAPALPPTAPTAPPAAVVAPPPETAAPARESAVVPVAPPVSPTTEKRRQRTTTPPPKPRNVYRPVGD